MLSPSGQDGHDSANQSAASDRQLDALLWMTRDLIDVDVALLTEIRDGQEIARQVAGEWPQLEALDGASIPLVDTFCQRMLDGRIGNYIRDVENHERVSGLAMRDSSA